MYSFFSPFPFLRILLLWILGILIHRNQFFALLLPFFLLDWSWRTLFAYLLVGVSFLHSEILSLPTDPKIPSHHAFVIRVSQKPIQGLHSYRIPAEVLAVRSANQWRGFHTQCLLFMRLDQDTVLPGQHYLVMDPLQAIQSPIMPEAFDWRSYYAQQGVFYSNFVRKSDLIVLNKQSSQESFLSTLRDEALTLLHQALPRGVHRQVADAMFLGVSNGLDFETRQSYASLGAIHILSVSGMHIGLLYLGLQFVFGFIRKFRPWGSTVFLCIMLLLLWSYAAMTGFSAPVLRSAWMFSVMLLGQTYRKRLNPLNSWAFAGFVLLLFTPNDLFQVGFQLSFMAVLGLLLFQNGLVHCWKFRYWLPKQIWELSCVAFTAQLLSAPFIIYYFHQFPHPFYFFLLNPLLVLLSSVTLGLGFLYLALASIGFGEFVGICLRYSFEILHGLMFATTDHWMTVMPFMRLSIFEMICYFVGLIFIAYWWKSRKLIGLHGSIVTVGFIIAYRTFESPRQEAYLTTDSGNPVFAWIDGMHGRYLGMPSPAWLQSNVSAWWAIRQVVDTVGNSWPEGSFRWHYQGNDFVYLTKPSLCTDMRVRHLILSPQLDLRDSRFLKSWQQATWYFLRKPSDYRFVKMRPYWPRRVVYLYQQPAVHFP